MTLRMLENIPRGVIIWVIALLLPSLCWSFMDHSVWPWDQAMYGEGAVRLWYMLTRHISAYGREIITTLGFKPPGTVWIEQFFVPVGQAFGSIEAGLLLGVVCTEAVALFLGYRICALLYPGQPLVAYSGIAVVGAAPLFVAMNHQLFTEPLQLLCAMYIYWIAAIADTARKPKVIAHLVLAAALGLAAKTTTPFYCVLPGCYAIYSVLRRRPVWMDFAFSRSEAWLLTAGLALLGLTLAWYAVNLASVEQHVRDAITPSFALNYGQIRSFGGKLAFWSRAFQKCFLWLPLVWLFCGLALVAALRYRIHDDMPPLPARRWLVIAAILHCAWIICMFSLNIVEEMRYLLAVLPSVMIVATWLISRLPGWFWQALVLGMLTAESVVANAVSFGMLPLNEHLTEWLHPLDEDPTRMKDIENAARLTCTPQTANRYNMVGVELPWLNANTLSFYAVKAALAGNSPCHYTSLGYAEKDVGKAWQRLISFNIAYYISLSPSDSATSPDFLNQVSLPIGQKIRHDTAFTQVPFAFASKSTIVIFRHREE